MIFFLSVKTAFEILSFLVQIFGWVYITRIIRAGVIRSKARKKRLAKKTQPVRTVKPIDTFGLFKCDKCSCEYVFTNMIEFDNLIDTHACRKVPA